MNVQFAPTGRGLLTGPTVQWVEQLTDLALTHGVTTFLIGGDDAHAIERYATEVAPAVREAVAHERRPAAT